MKKLLVKILLISWISFSLFVWFYPKRIDSKEERRLLNQMPKLSLNSYMDENFSDNFEKFAQDQFPFRFRNRQAKALFMYNGLMLFENNDYYKDKKKAIKIEYPLKEKEIEKAIAKFSMINDLYLANSDVYVSLIPDKSYYSSNKTIPKIDYSKVEKMLIENMDYAEYIDIKNKVNLSNFYNTDIHWKQEDLEDVALTLIKTLGDSYDLNYEVSLATNSFRGVYYGHSALLLKKDSINYINNASIEHASVKLLNDDKEYKVYSKEGLESDDKYNFFLHGPQAIVEINNENANNGEHLIMFRDSFASSLTPYMISHYEKITLIDIRYIAPSLLGDLVDFSNSTVLFIYSGNVLNSSSMFK